MCYLTTGWAALVIVGSLCLCINIIHILAVIYAPIILCSVFFGHIPIVVGGSMSLSQILLYCVHDIFRNITSLVQSCDKLRRK